MTSIFMSLSLHLYYKDINNTEYYIHHNPFAIALELLSLSVRERQLPIQNLSLNVLTGLT